ncbi:hypothetical protein BGW36DRAFT_381101 [Talaromyces proteolyticus]|uniref:Uncharacterized protein n=1 Tax=Talaromyces proteolyticus TaxID=1131652 RepID=A0AAD4KTX6_9EURO|nr:uncharacterized protein BGW36DRAFT_381101 [Talaromyces proteolyticus]KAH8696491.1 hypothetical protein BGW36DRAFT_381101 [Talaromyces proteolyticus]
MKFGAPKMANYRYSRLKNDLNENELQQTSAGPTTNCKDDYCIRVLICCGILLVFIVALLVLYCKGETHSVYHLFCEMGLGYSQCSKP